MINNLRNTQIDRLVSRDTDLHGRRIRNASPSEFANDYVIQKELNDLRNLINSLESTITTNISNSTAITLLSYAPITSPITVTSLTSPSDGVLLFVYLLQDATGYAVSWDTAFQAPPDIPTDPSTYSSMLWCGMGTKWILTGIPVVASGL